jgi:hypothetical protein
MQNNLSLGETCKSVLQIASEKCELNKKIWGKSNTGQVSGCDCNYNRTEICITELAVVYFNQA